MKNSLIVVGFIVCALASFGLMQLSKSLMKDYGEWAPDGKHMQSVENTASGMLDKCRLDRMQGRIKGHKESMECSNPAIHDAFAKEGFPHMDKVDEFLAQRVEYAKKADKNEITEEELRQLVGDAQTYLLESAKPATAEAKK